MADQAGQQREENTWKTCSVAASEIKHDHRFRHPAKTNPKKQGTYRSPVFLRIGTRVQ